MQAGQILLINDCFLVIILKNNLFLCISEHGKERG